MVEATRGWTPARLVNFCRSSTLGVEVEKFVVREPKLAVHDLDARSKRRRAGREADREDQLSAVLDHRGRGIAALPRGR